MKIPKRLKPLVEDGLVDDVLFQLMSGKEAQVFVVRCGEHIRCAKVYKESNKRSFKQAVQYQEGRSVRNSRRARAMAKGTRFGQKEQENAWLTAEVDALYRLAAAGVRVPQPHGFVDGVLLMDLVQDADGDPAPRLDDVTFTPELARDYHSRMMVEIVRMLCAGLVHGDLSEFNVLVDAQGPVVIDLPQAVNAAGNNNAQMMLARDVKNMTEYFGRYDPTLLITHFAEEIWELYEHGNLQPDSKLTGEFSEADVDTDIATMMRIIEFAKQEEDERIERERAARDGEF
ncbi:PA4780 family RIO1-like protein kinase [Teredinibacter purpureus]|uniref:PA4780 family RIO1-like protein kinase n=1 Tax=Teredinibacter purpureus TaxID=2731756 RepID=UPI0005F85A94|nr:PA4780 family RIO1-like protein kinase [Teredinibacter purpureus]